MDCSIGKITAQLAQPGERLSSKLIDLLNTNIAPPEEIEAGDVYIRAMYIVSDGINSYGGEFPLDEHASLAKLLIDSPVMVGHRKDKLPIGRTFHTRLVKRKGENWIKSYFYWLKSATGAEDLRSNIDGGIYKECSIGFTFALPECSICGRDIRLCPHEPFETYSEGEAETTCHFHYRRIEQVLESSLVYRGAIPDTAVSKELKVEMESDEPTGIARQNTPVSIASIDSLKDDHEYLVIPHYESLSLSVARSGGVLTLKHSDGREFDQTLADSFPSIDLPEGCNWPARLVGFRGKERCSLEQLEKYLRNGSGPVSRLALLLIPVPSLPLVGRTEKALREIRIIPNRRAGKDELEVRAREIKTRTGVEIWSLEDDRALSDGYHFRPEEPGANRAPEYTLTCCVPEGRTILSFGRGKSGQAFAIDRFDPVLLTEGRRFLACREELSNEMAIPGENTVAVGEVKSLALVDDRGTAELSGSLEGTYAFRPIIIGGRQRFLFHRVTVR